MNNLSFIIVDDNVAYRYILRQIVQTQPQWSIVVEASNGLEATRLVAQYAPDVVLMDVSMPLMNGIEATRQIKQTAPNTRVIIFSGYKDEELRRESLQAGADYYLLKEDLDTNSLTQLITMLFP